MWQRGDHEGAVDALARAVALAPGFVDARNDLGNALLGLGRPQEAMPHYRAAVATEPDFAPAHYNIGNLLLAADDAAGAVDAFRAALRLAPDHPGAHNNLGNALRALGRIEDAAASYRAALALRPDLAGAHCNLGAALLALHRPQDALAYLDEAVRLNADYADAHNNRGGALLMMDRPDAALDAFRRAIAADGRHAQARFGEAMALLVLGRFHEGWAAYESRWSDPRFREGTRPREAPQWRNEPGSDVSGRTVLLFAEQGLGDTLQFVRYAALVRRLGARVVLEVQAPLVKLLRPLGDVVLAEGATLPRCDLVCPLPSLPLAFRTELHSIPARVPYVHTDEAAFERWRARLGPQAGLRVGVAISGNPAHPEDALRSIQAALWADLFAMPGIEWHLIQTEWRDDDKPVLEAHPSVRCHAAALPDMAETAALVAAMDLVVTVDTSLAHLAGAMGRPVWVLVQSCPDFRWLRGRDDSPWYPTARLYRQSRLLEWPPVLARVAADLAAIPR